MSLSACESHSKQDCRKCQQAESSDHCWGICVNTQENQHFRHDSGLDNEGENPGQVFISVDKVTTYINNNRCNRNRSQNSNYYPGMCEEHALMFNLTDKWKKLDKTTQDLLIFMCRRKELAPDFSGYFILLDQLQIKVPDFMKLILSPLLLWVLSPEIFHVMITTATLFELHTFSIVPDRFTYVFMLDYICENVPEYMNGKEQFEKIGFSEEDIVTMKWNRVSKLVTHGFEVGSLGLFSPFDFRWKDIWIQRYEKWMNYYIKNKIMTEPEILKSYKYIHGLIDSLSDIALKYEIRVNILEGKEINPAYKDIFDDDMLFNPRLAEPADELHPFSGTLLDDSRGSGLGVPPEEQKERPPAATRNENRHLFDERGEPRPLSQYNPLKYADSGEQMLSQYHPKF